MATGFVYTVTTLTNHYAQKAFCNVPTQFGNRLYFGPCKKQMRPKVRPGDYVFGISPSNIGPRRIVFIGHVEERVSFSEAHERYPALHGPEGPIHVEPVNRQGQFPHCSYAHIPGAMHANSWEKDLASRALDAFLVCTPQQGCVGRWLGNCGPRLSDEIMNFLKTCSVHGRAGQLSPTNANATIKDPIAHGRLYTGLHLETIKPEILVDLCNVGMSVSPEHLDAISVPIGYTKGRQTYEKRNTSWGCR